MFTNLAKELGPHIVQHIAEVLIVWSGDAFESNCYVLNATNLALSSGQRVLRVCVRCLKLGTTVATVLAKILWRPHHPTPKQTRLNLFVYVQTGSWRAVFLLLWFSHDRVSGGVVVSCSPTNPLNFTMTISTARCPFFPEQDSFDWPKFLHCFRRLHQQLC